MSPVRISFRLALAFEAALAILGAGLILLFFGAWPERTWEAGARVWIGGMVFSVPPLVFAFFAIAGPGSRWGPLRRIRQILERSLLPALLKDAGVFRIFLLAAAAGFGEEVLFRAFLHNAAGYWVTNAVFALLHALTPFYFVLAFFMSAYLGWLYEWAEGRLWVPVLVHGIYDFVALLLYRGRMSRESPGAVRWNGNPEG